MPRPNAGCSCNLPSGNACAFHQLKAKGFGIESDMARICRETYELAQMHVSAGVPKAQVVEWMIQAIRAYNGSNA